MTFKHMYETPIRYKNFAGVERNTKLHFHLTPREFADWMIDNKDQADELVRSLGDVEAQIEGDIDGEATETQKLSMLRMVRILAELSYGRPSDDGEVFDKSETKKFTYSAAYDAFRLFLFENPKELSVFITTLLSEEVMKEFGQRMELLAAAQTETNAESTSTPAVPMKDPKDMSHEELVAAMQARNTQ